MLVSAIGKLNTFNKYGVKQQQSFACGKKSGCHKATQTPAVNKCNARKA